MLRTLPTWSGEMAIMAHCVKKLCRSTCANCASARGSRPSEKPAAAE